MIYGLKFEHTKDEESPVLDFNCIAELDQVLCKYGCKFLSLSAAEGETKRQIQIFEKILEK